MDKKENNNQMLSFDKLLEELGIDDVIPLVKEPETKKSDIENNPVIKKVVPKTGKSVFENSTNFIDITDQYTNPGQEPVKVVQVPLRPVKEVEQVVISTPETPKKRVKTFNEMFFDFFSLFLPVKDDSSREKVRKIIMDMSIILIISCLIGFAQMFTERKEETSLINSVNNTEEADKLKDNFYAVSWQESFSNQSSNSFPSGMKKQFSYFYSANNDMAGWIRINNTDLDVQLVQGDDNEYYQSKDFYGNDSKFGCPYVDYRNSINELDDNTIIYGPNYGNSLMFSVLEQYKSLEGYKKAPLIEFSTLDKSYVFKIFAVFIATDSPATDNGFSYTISDFASDNRFGEFISEVKNRSLILTNVSVQTDDKLITLVTPSHEFDGARLVVMGRMVRENESSDVDMSDVTFNTSPKYPQMWYDKKGESNPFA